MDIKNYICPVCQNAFNDSDDVVFCPECGTPHHRECWQKNGKCFNEQLHGKDDIEATYRKKEKIQDNTFKTPYTTEIKEEQKKIGPITFEIKEPELKINPSQTFLIDGKPSVLYDVAVKKNQRYYIPHFMAISQMNKRGISWNFWAFLVPLAWSVYRKMYKFAVLILAIYMLIFGLSAHYVLSNEGFIEATNACLEEDPNFIENVSIYLAGGDASLTVKQQNFIDEMNQLYVPAGFSYFTSFALIAVRAFMGLRANKEYMKEIKKTIEKGEKSGFTDDKLKMFVYRKRGIVPIIIPVIIGLFEWLTIY